MTEGIGLFPCHTHYGIVVVRGIREVIAHVFLVVGIGEVVHPAGRIRIDIHDISVQEIPRTTQLTVNRFPDNLSLIIDISRVLRDPYLLVGIHCDIRVQVSLLGNEAITTQSGCRIVIHLVTVVHLMAVEHLLTRNRVRSIQTVDDLLLVLTWFTRQGFLPVNHRTNLVALFVSLHRTIRLIDLSQTFPQDGVTHIVHKLAVFRVGHLSLVHPETVYGDISYRCLTSPKTILGFHTHLQVTTLDERHAIGRRLIKTATTCASHLTAFR